MNYFQLSSYHQSQYSKPDFRCNQTFGCLSRRYNNIYYYINYCCSRYVFVEKQEMYLSDLRVLQFCLNFMNEHWRHIRPFTSTSVPHVWHLLDRAVIAAVIINRKSELNKLPILVIKLKTTIYLHFHIKDFLSKCVCKLIL